MTTAAPFFSVIIPAYNRSGILADTIRSVLAQTFKEFELIVVDDGSTDDTAMLVKSIPDERIHYIYQKNSERSAARNNGIKHSRGQYICFLDSDDSYRENHLSVLYDFIQKNHAPVGMLFCNHSIQKGNKTHNPHIPKVAEGKEYLYFLDNPVIPARVCIHYAVLKKFQFDTDIVIVEDTVLWVHIALHYPVFHIPEYTVVYLLHDENSVNIRNNSYQKRLHGLKKFFSEKEIRNAVPASKRNMLISDTHYGIARHYDFHHKFYPMCYHLFLSFVYAAFHKQNKAKLYMIVKYLLMKKQHD